MVLCTQGVFNQAGNRGVAKEKLASFVVIFF